MKIFSKPRKSGKRNLERLSQISLGLLASNLFLKTTSVQTLLYLITTMTMKTSCVRHILLLPSFYTHPLLVLVIKVSWSLPSEDALVLDAMSQWLDWVESTASERGILHPFIFMNYADTSQPVYANNVKPETLAVMKKTQAKYDPEGVFTNLLRGGFKLPPFCDSEEQAPASFLVQDGYEDLLGRELLSRNVTQSMKKTECTLRYMSQVDS